MYQQTHTHKHPLCSGLNLEETAKQLKQKLSCLRRKDEERVQLDKKTEMGEDWDRRAFPCLYHIPSVSCYSFVLLLAEGGLTKRVKERERGRDPTGNSGSQKIYFPLSRNQFFKQEQYSQ